MGLKDQIEERAKEIRTDGYGMSIGEVLSLYREGDIEIHPEFQRIFRWDITQKSRLVESILLGIPIPPIFVSQRHDGVWDVIDGVQRLSTILEFMGEYKDEVGRTKTPLALEGGEYLSELNGYAWSSQTHKLFFDDALKRDFKRAKLDFRIITKESDANAKYDLFQRLNAGSVLSPQEARNCLLVMLNREMFIELGEMSSSEQFAATVLLSERQEDRAYRDELVLRFFAQTEYAGPAQDLPEEFGEYLTSWMKQKAEAPATPPFDRLLFDRTFTLLARVLGEDSFRRFDGQKHLGPFSISGYEFISSGLAAHIDFWESQSDADVRGKISEVWSLPEFLTNSGSGVSSRRRLPRLVVASHSFFAS